MHKFKSAPKPRFPIEEDKLLHYVKKRRDAAYTETTYLDWKDNVEKFDRAYRMEFKNQQDIPKWQSQIFMSLAFTTVETVRGFLRESFFSNDPFFSVLPGGRDDPSKAYNTEFLMRYYFRRNRFVARAMDFLNDVCKVGYAVGQTFWRVEVKPEAKQALNRLRRELGDMEIDVPPREFLWDDPWFSRHSGLDFVHDPFEKFLQDSRWCTLDEEQDFYNLVSDGRFFNLDKVWDRVKDGSRARFDIPSRQFGTKEELEKFRQDEFSRLLKLTTFSGTIDIHDARVPDRQQKYIILVADDETIIDFRELPYNHSDHPFVEFGLINTEETVRGLGCMQPIYPTQVAMNRILNQRIDGLNLILNPRIAVNKTALIKKDALDENFPGQTIEVESFMDAKSLIHPLNVPDSHLSTFRDTMNFLKEHAEGASAVNPQSAGGFSQKVRSATESSLAAAGSTARFADYAKWVSETGMNPLLRQMVSLGNQFTTQDKFLWTQDMENPMLVSPGMITDDVDIFVKDLTSTNKDVQSQLYINLLAAMAPWIQQIEGLNVRPLLEGFLRNIPLIKNPDEIIPPAGAPGTEAEQMVQNQPQRAQEQLGPGVTPNIQGAPAGQGVPRATPSQAIGGMASVPR